MAAAKKYKGLVERLIGQQIGDLLVLDLADDDTTCRKYRCSCKCGSTVIVRRSNLLNKSKPQTACKSCSNYRKSKMFSKTNLTGQRFGKLTVINKVPAKNKGMVWECLCDCGFTVTTNTRELTEGRKQDCTINGRNCVYSPNGKCKTVGELTWKKFKSFLQNADRREIKFEVSQEYLWNLFLEQNRRCYFTRMLITLVGNSPASRWSRASLDRLNPSLGYTEGNLVWVNTRVNMMKYTLTEEQFLWWIEKVYKPSKPPIDFKPILYPVDNSKYKGVGNLSGGLWSEIKKNARRREIFVEATIDEAWKQFLDQKGCCALTGLELTLTPDRSPHTASLDRIDSNVGYTKENIQWVHKTINNMKWDLHNEAFKIWCQIIYDWKIYLPSL